MDQAGDCLVHPPPRAHDVRIAATPLVSIHRTCPRFSPSHPPPWLHLAAPPPAEPVACKGWLPGAGNISARELQFPPNLLFHPRKLFCSVWQPKRLTATLLSTRRRAQSGVKVQKPAKAVKAVAAAAPAVFAAAPAVAQDVLFQVAELGDNVDEETALYVIVGGALTICTAVLSLVIGSNLFIKNIVNK